MKVRIQGPQDKITTMAAVGAETNATGQYAPHRVGIARITKPHGIRTNVNGQGVTTQCLQQRNTLGGVRPGGADYLVKGQRRLKATDGWSATKESQPHGPGTHAKSHHPLSPRRLIAISPTKQKEQQARKGAMDAIMGHDYVDKQ